MALWLAPILDITIMQAKSNTGNVIRLAAAQALSMTTMNVNIINTALVGSLLSPLPWLATLGLSLQFVTSMLTTLPASLLMVRFGRRPVFMGGVMIAADLPLPRHCYSHFKFLAVLSGVDVSWRCAWLCRFLSLCRR
jgi:MFS family permease